VSGESAVILGEVKEEKAVAFVASQINHAGCVRMVG